MKCNSKNFAFSQNGGVLFLAFWMFAFSLMKNILFEIESNDSNVERALSMATETKNLLNIRNTRSTLLFRLQNLDSGKKLTIH